MPPTWSDVISARLPEAFDGFTLLHFDNRPGVGHSRQHVQKRPVSRDTARWASFARRAARRASSSSSIRISSVAIWALPRQLLAPLCGQRVQLLPEQRRGSIGVNEKLVEQRRERGRVECRHDNLG